MAEWLKAAVLKTAEARASVGSNPTPSAIRLRSKSVVVEPVDFELRRDATP